MWILPTAGRPDLAQIALDCLTRSGISTPGVVVVDGDDNPAYHELILPPGWSIEFLDQNAGPLAIFQAAFEAHPDEAWYGWLADDAYVRSGPGWDHVLIAKAGPRGIASPDDLWLKGTRIVWGAVFGGDLVRAVGWWMPPRLRHTFCDDAWEMIGQILGCWRFVPEIVVEHKHPFNQKREADATHALTYRGVEDERAIWQTLRQTEIPAVIARVREAWGIKDADEEARLDRARSRSLFLATPVYDKTAWQFSKSLALTYLKLSQLGIRFQGQFLCGSSNLPLARNKLAETFLASDCDDMIMIDADMGWDAGDVVRLLASSQDVIGAIGRKKGKAEDGDLSSWCVRLKPGSNVRLVQDEMGAIEVDRIGTGFLKISREALERIARERPSPPGRKASYYRYFYFDDEDSGEDYVFCETWQSVGGRVWADINIDLEHAGNTSYRGRFADIVRPAAPQTETNPESAGSSEAGPNRPQGSKPDPAMRDDINPESTAPGRGSDPAAPPAAARAELEAAE